MLEQVEWNPLDAMPDSREYEVYHVVNEEDQGMTTFHAHHHYEFYIYIAGNVNIAVEEKCISRNRTPCLFILRDGNNNFDNE